MKKMILLATVSLLTTTAFADTLTCAIGQVGVSEGTSKILNTDELKKNPLSGVILEKDGIKYLITISDIYSKQQDGSDVVMSKDALVFSMIKDNKAVSSAVSDGKHLIYFDAEKNLSLYCQRD